MGLGDRLVHDLAEEGLEDAGSRGRGRRRGGRGGRGRETEGEGGRKEGVKVGMCGQQPLHASVSPVTTSCLHLGYVLFLVTLQSLS